MITSTVKIITNHLDMPFLPIIICIDLYSLYKYLNKLSTTKEKYLIIDIIVLC
jgi:hypothetical protein